MDTLFVVPIFMNAFSRFLEFSLHLADMFDVKKSSKQEQKTCVELLATRMNIKLPTGAAVKAPCQRACFFVSHIRDHT